MKNIYKISFWAITCLALLSASAVVLAYQNPTANAGPDLYLTSGAYNSNSSAILQGSGYDPNGGSLNFYWTCTDGTLSNSNVPQPLFTAPNNVWQSSVYTCTLTATDNYGLSSSDSATIYINYNNNNNYNYNINVQTNNATDNYNGQATLNGNISSNNNIYGTIYGWFQWGTTTSYGFESNHQAVQYAGPFNQHIAGLVPGTIYHFRAVSQQNNGNLVYGQDLTFNTAGYNAGYVAPVVYAGGGQVAGASTVSTGLTNNFLTDSFFLPLLIIISGLCLYFSGLAYRFADWLATIIQG